MGNDVARPGDPVGRLLYSVAYAFVLIGGTIMAVVTVMTVVSVLGRWLFLSPIYGDFRFPLLALCPSAAWQRRRGSVPVVGAGVGAA